MDVLQWMIDLLSDWKFWAILLAITVLSWGLVSRYFRRVNLSKGKVMLISIIAIFLAVGGASMLGVGTVGTTSDVMISQIQTTTAYVMTNDTSGQTTSDSGTDDTKQSDFYIDEGFMNSDARIDSGTFLVTRTGTLEADSCQVRVIKPPRYEISDTTYHIVNEDATTGIMDAHIYTGSSTGTADLTDPKETNMLAFAEGVATGYVAFNISIDETGFDPLTQYDTKAVNVDICGYPYKYVLHKNDA